VARRANAVLTAWLRLVLLVLFVAELLTLFEVRGLSLATLVHGYLSASRIVWSERVGDGQATHGDGHVTVIRAGEAVSRPRTTGRG